jgi:molecular chaperone DnaK
VNVSAKDLGTGKEQHITITSGSNMSDEEIDKAVKEAAEYEAQDKKRKEGIDTKNDADAIVFQTEKAMEEAGAALDASDKAAVEEDLKALKETIAKCGDELTDDQINDLKAGREKLMASAQKLFEKLYQQQAAQQQGQGGPQPGPGPEANAGGSADDDVVDGDFREV